MQETQVRSLGQEDPLEEGTLVLLPGEFQEQRSLVGYSPWGCKESDTTEFTHTHTHKGCELLFTSKCVRAFQQLYIIINNWKQLNVLVLQLVTG